MTDDIEIRVENHVGCITLNRKAAINALSPEMISAISEALSTWSDDPNVRMVLFEGNGEKGFCAGGDVRHIRQLMLAEEQSKALDFFDLEYAMNLQIATYHKPIVALTHGVVMGGGLGIAGHGKYRITAESARFAMPEAAIGFFCDVGVRTILAKTERHRALMFMLTGSLVGAVDAVILGLSDTVIYDNAMAPMRQSLMAAGEAKDVDAEICNICARFAVGYGYANFCNLADQFSELFNCEDAQELYARLENEIARNSELTEVAKIILSRCPMSNWAHVAALDVARENPDIAKILADDLRLGRVLALRGDFLEGVRAVLVDKDHAPKWHPTDIALVDGKEILACFG